jgi:DNA-binding MarR family transcriptional regulator
MKAKTTAALALIQEIRRSFQILREAGDTMNVEDGVTAAMRSVMEAVATSGPRTVPDIAAEKHVSRQHIQKNVDELIQIGLARSQPNPAHRRSVLIALTPEGDRLFASMKAAEIKLLDEVVATLPANALKQATDSLASFRRNLESKL